MKINVLNEWGRLEACWVGTVHSVYWPDDHPLEHEAPKSGFSHFLTSLFFGTVAGKRIPEVLVRGMRRESDSLAHYLELAGVEVKRPIPLTPLPVEPFGLSQMFARDPVMAIGDRLIIGQLQMETRRKETRGFIPFLNKLENRGVRVERLMRPHAYLEGGDVLLDWPHIYVGIGKYASNERGVEWLQELFGHEAHVIPVYIKDPSVLHLDHCMTLIGPKRGIIHRASLERLPAPLEQYDWIEIDDATKRELGGNILMLDHQTALIQKKHIALARELRARGLNVVTMDFHRHARMHGGLRCATAPLRRAA